jgi:xanthine/uracil permease
LQHLFAMFGSTVLVPFLTGLPISAAGVINAKLDPKYAGILALVISMYNKVPIPDANNAAEIGSPVKNQY